MCGPSDAVCCRLVCQWFCGRTFLVTLADSEKDCSDRLVHALEDYDFEDLKRVDSIWTEYYDPGTLLREPEWVPHEELELKPHRLRKAAFLQNAAARPA